MRYTFYNYFTTIVALLILASCDGNNVDLPPETVEEILEDGVFQQTVKTVEATAPDFISAGSTRVELEYGGVTLSFFWDGGDYLGFWPDQADVRFGTPQQAPFIINASGRGQSNAVFDACGWGLLKGRRYYAYYPYGNSGAYNSVKVSYTGQRQISNASTGHLGAYDHMYSHIDVPANGAIAPMTFNHFDCIEVFRLNIPQDCRSAGFTDLLLTADSDVIVTDADFNPSSVAPVMAVSRRASRFGIALGSEDGNGIACDADGNLTVFVMMSPANNWLNRNINITLYDCYGDQYAASFKPTTVQQAGRVYEFSANMIHQGPDRINLSKAETANCYIVSEAGDYKFRAVKGNSAESVTPGSVKVLWETVNTTAVPDRNSLIKDNVSYSNGYILFSTLSQFREGNAVIAAYSGPNYTGQILWSWHIWLTDCPADEIYPNNAGVLMDRNLGALATSGNLANGLFYQWGRKDPFTGSAATNSRNEMATAGCAITAESQNSSRGTITYSIQHPATFICAGPLNGDWLSGNPKLGCNWQLATPDVEESLWYGGQDIKTKYDPCPPGYSVPYSGTRADEPDFWGAAYGGETYRFSGTSAGFILGGRSVTFTTGSGLYMPLANGMLSYYPTAGYISEQGQRVNDGKHMMLWSNFPAGRDNAGNWNVQYSACLDLNMADAYMLTTHWNSCRAAGKSVRCMKMRRNVTAQSENDNEGFGAPINSAW